MHCYEWSLVPERVELAGVDHDSLTTYEERVFIPGNNILIDTISLFVWLDEFVEIGLSESKSVRSDGQTCHQGSGLHESFTKHHLVMSLAWVRDMKWPAEHSSFMAMAIDMYSPEMNSIHVYPNACTPLVRPCPGQICNSQHCIGK